MNYDECTHVCTNLQSVCKNDNFKETFIETDFQLKQILIVELEMWKCGSGSISIHTLARQITARHSGSDLSRVKEDMLGCLMGRKEVPAAPPEI